MPDKRLRAWMYPPGGPGLEAALAVSICPGAILTAWDDVVLSRARRLAEDHHDCQVMPIGELLNQVLLMAGGEPARLASRGQRRAATGLALASMGPTSLADPFKSHVKVHDYLSDGLSELRQWGIDADGLRYVAGKIPGALGAKLEWVASLADLQRDSMETSRLEFASDRALACESLDPPESWPIARVVAIVAGPPRPDLEEWLKWASRAGLDVVVLIEAIVDRQDLFADSWAALARLQCRPKVVDVARQWWEGLFGTKIDGAPVSAVKCTTGDQLAEAEWVTGECRRLLDGGTPVNQIAVFSRSLEVHGPYLVLEGQRARVPFSVSQAVPLQSSGFARQIMSLLDAAIKGDPKSLAKCGRSSYLGVDPQVQASVEHAAGESMKSDDPWQSFESMLCEGDEWAKAVLTWRHSVLGQPEPMGRWLQRLRELVGSIVEHSSLSEEKDRRAETVIQRSIADRGFVYDQAGMSPLSATEFLDCALDIWEEETLFLPGLTDGILVTSNAIGFGPFEVVFMMGMHEGKLPRRRQEDALLNDRERDVINHMVDTGLSCSHDVAARERDEFVRLCASSQRWLVATCHQGGADSDSVPTAYLDELPRLLGDRYAAIDRPRSESALDPDSFDAQRERSVREAIELPRTYPAPPRAIGSEFRQLLSKNPENGMTVHEVLDATECPFRWAARHAMGVSGSRRGVGLSLLMHLPERAGLASAESQEVARFQLNEQLDHLVESLRPVCDPWEIRLVAHAGRRLIGAWVKNEFEARASRPADPGTIVSPADLQHEPFRGSVRSMNEGTLRLVGTVPAVRMVEGTPVATVFQSTKANERTRTQELRWALTAVALSKQERGCALEIDDGHARHLFCCLDRIEKPWSGLVRQSPVQMATDLAKQLDQALATVRRGAMDTVPGPHCRTCGFGDLCRSHIDYAEARSPFGAEIE